MATTLGEWTMFLLDNALALLQEHWPKLVGLGAGFIPVLWGIHRARRQWRSREFMNRFSISLNILRQDHGGMVLWLPAAAEYDVD